MKHIDAKNQLDLDEPSKERARLEHLRRMERIRQAGVEESKNHDGLINADWLNRACPEYDGLKTSLKGVVFHDARFHDTGASWRTTIPKDKKRKVTMWRVLSID